eukprot:GHRR01009350.1.p3 GENE.GHRR01009350.1~~GHRR01009350.1.p3  ORF type:complete len:103 (-),score=34.89 GHRR01009350.1:283-591(-)
MLPHLWNAGHSPMPAHKYGWHDWANYMAATNTCCHHKAQKQCIGRYPLQHQHYQLRTQPRQHGNMLCSNTCPVVLGSAACVLLVAAAGAAGAAVCFVAECCG